jgi:hypothetical protein
MCGKETNSYWRAWKITKTANYGGIPSKKQILVCIECKRKIEKYAPWEAEK